MLENAKAENCCGCSACLNICPKQAITMEPDKLGFLYPNVDATKCVNCGLCEKVCSFNGQYKTPENFIEPIAFAVRHKDIHEVESSRSGAAFVALSDWILGQGGVVYGAGYKDHFRVAHKRAENKVERDEFRGSKYVQSEIGSVFQDVLSDLEKGVKVLFSGTACQVAGLKSFLLLKRKVLMENLFLLDIVCHGVPSPYIWKDYLKYVEKKKNAQVQKVNFRDKEKFGWKAHVESFSFKDETLYTGEFTFLFYQHIMLRKSCGVCPFANLKRPADITIADFWGWEKVDPSFNKDDKGVSLVLCNSRKGQNLFDQIREKIICHRAELEDCTQPNMKSPTLINSKRESFERDYSKHGFEFILNKYGENGWRNRFHKLYVKCIVWIKKKVMH